MSVYFARIFAKSLVFFVFLYAVDFGFRAFFIAYIGILGGNLGTLESNAQIYQTFINGSRYFGQIIGVLSLIVFVLLLFCHRIDLGVDFSKSSVPNRLNRIFRKITFGFIALVLTLICFVNIANMGFYQIYGDTFNANLLGLIFDDRGAIFRTAMGGQYNLTLKILAWIAISAALVVAISAIFRKIDSAKWANLGANPANSKSTKFTRFAPNISAITLFLLFGFATLFAINGHFGFKGISLGKEIRPVSNTFLRQITTGAFRDLYIVFLGYRKIAHSKFSDYAQGESPQIVAKKFTARNFSGDKSLGESSDINLLDLLQKRVNREDLNDSQIQHIFYIIAESMSEWHFDSDFDKLKLSSELKKLAKQNGGFKADIFLQNAGSTIKSLDVQISGLLQTDIPLSLLAGRFDNIAFAPAVIMRDLGFEGSFYYGGSGSWQKLDSFVTKQGFVRILFGTDIVENAINKGYPAPYQNAWGAYDNHLFAFVRDKITAESTLNPNLKTFNMIMTTSNHPPYDAPVADFGAPMEAIKDFVENAPNFKRKAVSEKILAHIWWQDKVIAGFVREMSAKFPRSLFIITGDHYDREYPFESNAKITNAVPLIVYAPSLNFIPRAKIGSHIDITPTIIELVAPSGFKYASFGQSLLSGNAKNLPSLADGASGWVESPFALGFGAIATENFIYDGFNRMYFSDTKGADDESLADALFMQLKRAKALSWWIYKNGYVIPNDAKVPQDSQQ